jgi:dGTPase
MWPIAFPVGQQPGHSYEAIDDDAGRVEYLRARAIGNLIHAAVDVFKQRYADIMEGRFEQDLVGGGRFAADLKRISTASRTQIYATPAVLQIEAAGYDILGGLLNKIVPPLLSPEAGRSNAHKKILQILPRQFTAGSTPYERLLAATDFISGMTDSYALTLFRRLHGMELPGGSI